MSNRSTRRTPRYALLLALAMPLVMLPLAGTPVLAEQRGPVQRVAEGKVVNKADAIIPGAVVYLKDTKSLAVKSYISDEVGHFRFAQLGQNTDYEIWADSNGKRSKSKNISSFDSKSSFNFTLIIDTEK